MNSITNATPSSSAPEPSAQALLETIDRRLARLEETAARLDAVTRGGPAAVAVLTDTLDRIAARLAERGVDIDERARLAADLVEQLTAPATLGALSRILQRVDVLEHALQLVEQVPRMLAAVTDALDGAVARLGGGGFDVDARLRGVLRLIERMTAPEVLSALDVLLDARTLDAPRPVGAWGAFRALGDPDIQRALGLALSVAKQLGKTLGSAPSEHQLPAAAQSG